MRAALVFSLLLTGGCTRPPTLSLKVGRLDGSRPPQVVVRCHAEGLRPPLKYQWRLAPAVKQVGGNVPADEPTMLLQLSEPPVAASAWAECTVVGDDKVTLRGGRSLLPPAIATSPSTAQPGQVVTVRGSGFGPARNGDSAIYFVPRWGRARVADHECKGAAWSEAAISACVPTSLPPGEWQLRVQIYDDLASAPAALHIGAAPAALHIGAPSSKGAAATVKSAAATVPEVVAPVHGANITTQIAAAR